MSSIGQPPDSPVQPQKIPEENKERWIMRRKMEQKPGIYQKFNPQQLQEMAGKTAKLSPFPNKTQPTSAPTIHSVDSQKIAGQKDATNIESFIRKLISGFFAKMGKLRDKFYSRAKIEESPAAKKFDKEDSTPYAPIPAEFRPKDQKERSGTKGAESAYGVYRPDQTKVAEPSYGVYRPDSMVSAKSDVVFRPAIAKRRAHEVETTQAERTRLSTEKADQVFKETGLEKEGRNFVSDAVTRGEPVIYDIQGHHFTVPSKEEVYLLQEQIGKGNYKTTYKAMLVAGPQLEKLGLEHAKFEAISIASEPKDKAEKEELENEVFIHNFLKDRKGEGADLSNVAAGRAYKNKAGAVAIGTEFCNGGSLHAQLDNSQERYKIFKEMATGIKQLHAVGIVHRDVHPGNFLVQLDSQDKIEKVKIADFGKTIQIENKKDFTEQFMKRLRAPETLTGDDETLKSPAFDIFQLGVSIYHLYLGHPVAFDEKIDREPLLKGFVELGFEQFVAQQSNPQLWPGMKTPIPEELRAEGEPERKSIKEENPQLYEFILRMTAADPDARPTALEVEEFFANLENLAVL